MPNTSALSTLATGATVRELAVELQGLRDLIKEQDRRYTEGMLASEKAVATALAANEKAITAAFLANERATAAAFAAAEKAILKAEATNLANDVKNNDFRGQLKDQVATFPTRVEIGSRFSTTDERYNDSKKEFERYKDGIAKELAGIHDELSETSGQATGAKETKTTAHSNIQLGTQILGVIIGIIIGILARI